MAVVSVLVQSGSSLTILHCFCWIARECQLFFTVLLIRNEFTKLHSCICHNGSSPHLFLGKAGLAFPTASTKCCCQFPYPEFSVSVQFYGCSEGKGSPSSGKGHFRLRFRLERWPLAVPRRVPWFCIPPDIWKSWFQAVVPQHSWGSAVCLLPWLTSIRWVPWVLWCVLETLEVNVMVNFSCSTSALSAQWRVRHFLVEDLVYSKPPKMVLGPFYFESPNTVWAFLFSFILSHLSLPKCCFIFCLLTQILFILWRLQ